MLHPYDSYIWNWKLREQFETIKQETNDEIWDDHWSWKGHQQMYEWLIGVIDER